MTIFWLDVWPLLIGGAAAGAFFARFPSTNPLHRVMSRFFLLAAALGGGIAGWLDSKTGMAIALAAFVTTALLQLSNRLAGRPGEYLPARIGLAAILTIAGGIAVRSL